MQKVLSIIIVFFLFFGCKSDYYVKFQKNKILKIGSYNMKIFGPTKVSRINTLKVLAKIASNYDLLALQEIGSNNSNASDETCIESMDAYLEKINEVSGGDNYTYVRGNQYAFVYRKESIKNVYYSLYTETQTSSYQPLIVFFKAQQGNFDFSIISIHTSPDEAEKEIPALKIVMNEISSIYGDPDVICTGDFNADGSYYTEGNNGHLSGFPQNTYITVIPNSADTT